MSLKHTRRQVNLFQRSDFVKALLLITYCLTSSCATAQNKLSPETIDLSDNDLGKDVVVYLTDGGRFEGVLVEFDEARIVFTSGKKQISEPREDIARLYVNTKHPNAGFFVGAGIIAVFFIPVALAAGLLIGLS